VEKITHRFDARYKKWYNKGDFMIVIKKYKNRKYYCNGNYQTLKDIVEIIKGGNSIQVINHENKDITNETLKTVLTTQNFTNQDLISLINNRG